MTYVLLPASIFLLCVPALAFSLFFLILLIYSSYRFPPILYILLIFFAVQKFWFHIATHVDMEGKKGDKVMIILSDEKEENMCKRTHEIQERKNMTGS